MCVCVQNKKGSWRRGELELDIALEGIHIILGLCLVLLWFVLLVSYPRKNFSFFTKYSTISPKAS